MTGRLAIVATHPIQYLSPWYRHLASRSDLSVQVFYLWDFGVTGRVDPGFRQVVHWDVPLLAGYDSRFVANRSRRPGTHHPLGLWNPTILREVREARPDAVLLTAYNFASLLYLIGRWRELAVPLIFRGDSHRLVRRRGGREALRRRLIALIFRRMSAFLYVGAANREYFLHHGVPERKLFRSPAAVDNDRFLAATEAARREALEWRASLGIPAAHAVVLFAGKFEDKKRPKDLLSAFLGARLANASLLFVGSGQHEADLREAARAHGNVHVAPFQNQSLMPRVYAAADLFVLPSYGPAETWGLAVNEAMCMGRAVIASDHVGCARDLVKPYRNGLTFAAGKVDELASRLTEAVSDRARLEAWGAEGRRMIEGFSYEQATGGVVRALQSLGALGEPAPR